MATGGSANHRGQGGDDRPALRSLGADRQAAETVPAALELAEKATGKRPKTVGILMDNTASPVSFAKPLREGGLERLGVKLVVDQIFTPPLSDATPLIEKVRAARPDFL